MSFSALDFLKGSSRRRNRTGELTFVLAKNQTAHERSAQAATYDVVGDAEKPGLEACLAPEGEPSAQSDDENVVQQVFQIRAWAGQAAGPTFDIGCVLLVQLVQGIGPFARPLRFGR